MSTCIYSTLMVDPGESPKVTRDVNEIVVVDLAPSSSSRFVVQFRPSATPDTIRYLRELAAVASDMADRMTAARRG